MRRVREILQSLSCEFGKQCEVDEYVFTPVDLNGDGIAEYIVVPPRMCGSGGCRELLVMRKGNTWALVADVFGVLVVQESTTAGLRDIVLSTKEYPRGEGSAQEKTIRLAWNGASYVRVGAK